MPGAGKGSIKLVQMYLAILRRIIGEKLPTTRLGAASLQGPSMDVRRRSAQAAVLRSA